MSFTLGDEDRRAVDMLLSRDGTRANGNGNGDHDGSSQQQAAAAQGGQFHKRIQRVEQLLAVLDNMPAGDPPQNLVSRILERIAEDPHGTRTAQPAAAPQPTIDPTRPLA